MHPSEPNGAMAKRLKALGSVVIPPTRKARGTPKLEDLEGVLLEPPDPIPKELHAEYRRKLASAGGHIPTESERDLLGQLVAAEARCAHYNKIPIEQKDKSQLQDERWWADQFRRLWIKCRFLRTEKAQREPPKKKNPFKEFLEVDVAKIDAKMASKYVDAANQYARDVTAGKIPACVHLKAATKRHLKNLEQSKTRDFNYKFSAYMADRACRFIELLPHVKGKWAKGKTLLHLEPWECFLVTSLFGWLDKTTNLRRFREAYWEICRKNGKSILAAAIGLYMFCADGEFGAEVFSGATTEKQAWEVFRPARLMVMALPQLQEALEIEVNAKTLLRNDGSRFEPIIGKPGDGASPSCSIIDEFHEHDTPDLYDTMETGTLAREQPLILKITTAGFNLAGPCYEHRRKALQVLGGVLVDERLFAVIFTLDEKDETAGIVADDWADPTSLRKANPNYGVSVDIESLLAKQRSAVLNVSEQNKFKTKHLNVWCSARSQWISMAAWNAAGDITLKEEDFKGVECRFMFDLASKLDIAAYLKLFMREINGARHYYVFGKYYLPENVIEEPSKNQLMYQKWVKKGLLTLTDGATTDFDKIKTDMLADAKEYNPAEIVHDPFNATHMAQLLLAESLNVVEFVQKPQNFAVPMDEVEAALKDGRLHHDGNEMLTWMMNNVTVRPAKKGLFWPTKETRENKIDGPVAMIMGIARFATEPEKPKEYQVMFL